MRASILKPRLLFVKQTLKTKAKSIVEHPATKKALHDMKPEKSLWGILGVLLFFIAPEIIAYFYSQEITLFAKEALLKQPPLFEKTLYNVLIMLFEEGVSWLNLGIGVVLLVWLFF